MFKLIMKLFNNYIFCFFFFFTDDVKNICFLLIKLEEFNICHDLQTTLESFQTSILDHKSIVWPIFVS